VPQNKSQILLQLSYITYYFIYLFDKLHDILWFVVCHFYMNP